MSPWSKEGDSGNLWIDCCCFWIMYLSVISKKKKDALLLYLENMSIAVKRISTPLSKSSLFSDRRRDLQEEHSDNHDLFAALCLERPTLFKRVAGPKIVARKPHARAEKYFSESDPTVFLGRSERKSYLQHMMTLN